MKLTTKIGHEVNLDLYLVFPITTLYYWPIEQIIKDTISLDDIAVGFCDSNH